MATGRYPFGAAQPGSAAPPPRRFFIDVGARYYNTSCLWFRTHYPAGEEFKIIAFEVEPRFAVYFKARALFPPPLPAPGPCYSCCCCCSWCCCWCCWRWCPVSSFCCRWLSPSSFAHRHMNLARMQDHPEVELQTVAVGTKAGKVTFDFGMAHAADTVADPSCESGRSAPPSPLRVIFRARLRKCGNRRGGRETGWWRRSTWRAASMISLTTC